MSERDQGPSESQALRELSARVEELAKTVDDWGAGVAESVGKSLTAELIEAEGRAVAHQAELAAKWKEKLGDEVQRQEALTAKLDTEAHNLHVLLSWQQELSEPWLLGWSRDRWQVVVVSVLLALSVSWGGVAIYNAVGAGR